MSQVPLFSACVPRERQVPVDEKVAHSSTCTDRDAWTSDHPPVVDFRQQRLFTLQVLFLLVISSCVFAGICLYDCKIFRIHPSLDVTKPLFDTHKAKTTLGSLIVLDLIHQLQLMEDVSASPSNDSRVCGIQDSPPLHENISAYVVLNSAGTSNTTIKDSTALQDGRSTLAASPIALLLSRAWTDAVCPRRVKESLTIETLQAAVVLLAQAHPKLRLVSRFLAFHNPSDDLLASQQIIEKTLQQSGLHYYSLGKPSRFTDSSVIFVGGRLRADLLELEKTSTVFTPEVQRGLTRLPSAVQRCIHAILGEDTQQWTLYRALFGTLGVSADVEKGPHEYLKKMFIRSAGFLSPLYPLGRRLHTLLMGPAVYILIGVIWCHSLFSPHPLTLVHFPRLSVVYVAIHVYRSLVLYQLAGHIESALFPDVDFSDNIVHALAVGLVLTMECVAAETSHTSQPESTTHCLSKDNSETSESEPHVRRPSVDAVVKPSFSRQHLQQHFFSAMSSPLFLSQPPIHKGDRMASSLPSSPANTIQLMDMTRFVYISSGFIVLCLSYCSFFTAFYFHTPMETIIGLLVGVLGLYVPFWVAVSSGCVSLERLGIVNPAW